MEVIISMFILGICLIILGLCQFWYPLDFRLGALGMLYPEQYKKLKKDFEILPITKLLLSLWFISSGGLLFMRAVDLFWEFYLYKH